MRPNILAELKITNVIYCFKFEFGYMLTLHLYFACLELFSNLKYDKAEVSTTLDQ